jgi:AcrR family transcriptional regulator
LETPAVAKNAPARPAARGPAASAPTRAPRWQRRKEARPAEILEAALAVFAEKGFAAARLDQVAKAAGVSKGTLYLYFDSKEALFEAVVRSAIVPRLANAEALLRDHDGSAAEFLAKLYRMFAAVMADGQVAAIPKLVIAEAGNFPDLARFYLREVVSRGLRLMGAVLERGVARGEFRPMNPAHATRLMIAPVLFLALWRQSLGRHDDTQLDGEAFLADALTLITQGLAVRGGGETGRR